MTGTIKTIVTAKGFFFLRPDQGQGDIFGHASQLANCGFTDLQVGDRCEFEMGTDQRSGRSRAEGIRLLF